MVVHVNVHTNPHLGSSILSYLSCTGEPIWGWRPIHPCSEKGIDYPAVVSFIIYFFGRRMLDESFRLKLKRSITKKLKCVNRNSISSTPLFYLFYSYITYYHNLISFINNMYWYFKWDLKQLCKLVFKGVRRRQNREHRITGMREWAVGIPSATGDAIICRQGRAVIVMGWARPSHPISLTTSHGVGFGNYCPWTKKIFHTIWHWCQVWCWEHVTHPSIHHLHVTHIPSSLISLIGSDILMW